MSRIVFTTEPVVNKQVSRLLNLTFDKVSSEISSLTRRHLKDIGIIATTVEALDNHVKLLRVQHVQGSDPNDERVTVVYLRMSVQDDDIVANVYPGGNRVYKGVNKKHATKSVTEAVEDKLVQYMDALDRQ